MLLKIVVYIKSITTLKNFQFTKLMPNNSQLMKGYRRELDQKNDGKGMPGICFSSWTTIELTQSVQCEKLELWSIFRFSQLPQVCLPGKFQFILVNVLPNSVQHDNNYAPELQNTRTEIHFSITERNGDFRTLYSKYIPNTPISGFFLGCRTVNKEIGLLQILQMK